MERAWTVWGVTELLALVLDGCAVELWHLREPLLECVAKLEPQCDALPNFAR